MRVEYNTSYYVFTVQSSYFMYAYRGRRSPSQELGGGGGGGGAMRLDRLRPPPPEEPPGGGGGGGGPGGGGTPDGGGGTGAAPEPQPFDPPMKREATIINSFIS